MAAPAAHAQSAVELTWDAPAECPQESAVREQLNALSGKPTPARRRLRAAGHVEHVGKRYRLTLSVREGDALRERTMNADSCTDLAGAAAVALGLLIRNERPTAGDAGSTSGADAAAGHGDQATAAGGEAAGARDATGARSASSAAAAPATAKKSTDRDEGTQREDVEASPGMTSAANTASERRWRFSLRAPVGVLALGRLPKPNGGVAAGAGVSYDAWRVNVAARVLGTQTVAANNAYGAGARVGHRDLELGVCRDWRDGRVALAPCFITELQRETARGLGLGVTPQPRSTLSVVLAAGVDARWFAFDWLALTASAAVGVETTWPTLQVTTAGDVKKLGPLELSFGLGPEWIF